MYTRREAIGGLGAAAALMSTAPSWAQRSDTTRHRKGPRLRPGDTVGVIAPAGWPADPGDYDRALQRVSSLGLIPKAGANLRARHGYLAGTDAARAADVNAMFADDSVKAVMAIRGGWGCARLLPYLNWDAIRANPKIVVGFSDITALHLSIAARGGFPTIHGPNIGSEWGPQSMDTFRRLVFEAGTPLLVEAVPPPPPPPIATPTAPPGAVATPTPPFVPGATPPAGPAPSGPVPPGFTPPGAVPPAAAIPFPPPRRTRTIRPGRATGRLLGGNLTVLAALVGTPYLPSFDGAILFIEDVGEAEYRIDRMLTHLGLAGVLRGLAGVVFGQCSRCDTPNPTAESVSLDMVLNNHFARLNIPSFTGAWFGHISNQLNIPSGVRAEIDADAGTIRVLEAAVA